MTWKRVHVQLSELMRNKRLQIRCLLFLVYILFSFILFGSYKYDMSSDGIVYISLAQKYISGDFQNAVSSCWSPLNSWAMIPLLIIGIHPFFAFKIVLLTFGFLNLTALMKIMDKIDIESRTKTSLFLVFIVLMLYFALTTSQPDVILLYLSLLYLNQLLKPDYPTSYKEAIKTGIISSFGYFAKAYFFPFFIFHFLVMNAIFFTRRHEKTNKAFVVKSCLLTFLVFFSISGIWIGMISYKTGTFTLSSGQGYVRSLISPTSKGNPYNYKLYPPTNPTATSAWEEISNYDHNNWSPMASKADFIYQLKLAKRTTFDLFRLINSFTPYSIVVLLIILLQLMIYRVKTTYHVQKLILFLSFLIFPSGYMLVLRMGMNFSEREFYLLYVIIFLLGGMVISEMIKHFDLFRHRFASILILLIFIWMAIDGPKEKMQNVKNKDKEIYYGSKKLSTQFHVSGNIASNDRWSRTLVMAYLLDSKYYGRHEATYAKDTVSGSDSPFLNELRKFRIKYYFVWDESMPEQAYDYWQRRDINPDSRFYARLFRDCEQIKTAVLPNLTIYKIKETE
jgi:hypothetical protein